MAGVKGSQPSNLASTNINAADEEASAPQMGDLSGFQQDPESDAEDAAISAQNAQGAAPAAQAKPSLDDIFGGSQGQAQASSAPSLDDIFGSDNSQVVQPDQTDTEDTRGSMSLDSLSQQIQEAPTRFKASFAKTDKEKEQVLKETYGEDGVKKQDGEFYIKKDGKFRKFDSKNFELISDILDFGRDAIEQGVAGITTVAGTLSAAASNPIAGAYALPVARGIGGALGVDAADKTAEAMGIQRDPERNKLKELAGGAVGQSIGGAAVDMIPGVARAAGSQAYQLLDHITGGSLTAMAAKKAAEKQAFKFVPGEKIAQSAVQDVVDLANKVKESGLISDIPGTNSPISASQAAANTLNPGIQMEAKQVMQTKLGQGYVEEQRKMISNAIDKISKSISEVSPTGPAADESLGKAVNVSADAIQDFYGKTIGSLSGKARKVSEETGENISVDGLAKGLSKVSDEFGFKRNGNSLVTPGEDSSFALLPKPLQLYLKNIQEKVFNSEGKFSFAEAESEMAKISGFIENAPSPKVQQQLISIKNGIRDDLTNGVGTLLKSKEDQAKFVESKARYSTFKSSVDTLSVIFDKNEVTGRAMTKAIFSDTVGGLDKIRAARNLIEPDNPQLWQRMKADWFKGIIDDAGGDATKIVQKINKLGPEGLQEVFNDKTLKSQDIKEFGNLLSVINKSGMDKLSGPELGRMARLGYVAKRLLKGDVGSVAEMYGSSPNAQEFFSRGGIAKLTQIVPKKDQPFFKSVGEMVAEKANKTAKQMIPLADEAGKKAISNQVQSQADQLVNPLQGSQNAVPGR